MDASDIFKKLAAGTKFSSLRKNDRVGGKHEIKEEPKVDPSVKKRRKTAEVELSVIDRSDPIRLLDQLVTDQFDIDEDDQVHKGTDKRTTKQIEKEKIAELRNKHRISVIGKKVPEPVVEFDSLANYNVLPQIILNLSKAGYVSPTPIQMQAIPLMLEGRQILACAPTGSGKTAAFLVPIIQHLRGPKKGGFRACIVCPTRELAAQTFRECLRLSEGTNLKAIMISKISHVKEKFNPKAATKYDILVTTPNRLVYLLKQDPPMVSLKRVEWLIVDECDKLFEAGVRGFRDQLAIIYTACESLTIKRAMFSATQSPPLTKWCRKNLKDVVTVNVGVRNTACSDVDQELIFVGSEAGKLVAVRDLLHRGLTPPVLVFVQSKERAQELFNELIYDGINVDVIHSDRTQAQRDNVIRCFREGKIWVLICTELMGRGIDFKGVNLVVNYDFPPSTIAYIHRVGRTGRAGRRGKAVTYFTLDDTTNLRSIARIVKESGSSVSDYMLAIKKPSKREKKEYEKHAPERDPISTNPIYEQVLEKKKRNAIKRSKRKMKTEKK